MTLSGRGAHLRLTGRSLMSRSAGLSTDLADDTRQAADACGAAGAISW